MKPIPMLILIASAFTATCAPAAEPGTAAAAKPAAVAETAPSPTTAVTAPPNVVAPVPAAPAEAGAVTATSVNADDTNTVRMNFHAASLDIVLNYLAEAAGFVINVKPGTSVRGKVDVWSNNPMTREEALNLVDTVLNQNGLAAIRNGRTLTIVNRDEAKTQNIPVVQGADPEKIPATDKIVTQIMPVRFVEAAQLVKDLQPLVSAQTTMTANEAGNSIVMTDTQANIRKVAEIIHAIDTGAEDFTEVRVFRLANADPVATADLLSSLFPDESKSGSGNSQSPFASAFASRFGGGRFGGFGGGTPGGGGGGGGGTTGGGSNNQNQRIKKRNRVIAVADERTASIVVSATRDLMEQIGGVITDLDADQKGKKIVRVYRLENAEPQEALPVLQDIFQKNMTQNRNNSSSSQNNILQNRSQTQSQQNNSGTSRSGTSTGSRSGSGALPSFQ